MCSTPRPRRRRRFERGDCHNGRVTIIISSANAEIRGFLCLFRHLTRLILFVASDRVHLRGRLSRHQDCSPRRRDRALFSRMIMATPSVCCRVTVCSLSIIQTDGSLSSKWGLQKYLKKARLSFSRLGNWSTRTTKVERRGSPKCLWALGRIKCGAISVLMFSAIVVVILPFESDALIYMKAYRYPCIVQNGQMLSPVCLAFYTYTPTIFAYA